MTAAKGKGKPRGHAHGVDGCAECLRIFEAGKRDGAHLEWSAHRLAGEGCTSEDVTRSPSTRGGKGPSKYSGTEAVEELERVVQVLDRTRTDCLAGYSPEEILRIVRACWASGWDVWPDDLPPAARERAARGEAIELRESKWRDGVCLASGCDCRPCRRAAEEASEACEG